MCIEPWWAGSPVLLTPHSVITTADLGLRIADSGTPASETSPAMPPPLWRRRCATLDAGAVPALVMGLLAPSAHGCNESLADALLPTLPAIAR